MDLKNRSDIVTVPFLSDGLMLKGTLHFPKIRRPPFVVGSHGLVSSGDSPKQIALATKLSDAGIAFFRFDHRGRGQSEGDFKTATSLGTRINDLMNAIKIIGSRQDMGKLLGLFGSSMGGTVCLAAASLIPVPAMVTVAAPIQSRTIIRKQHGKERMDVENVFFNDEKRQFDLTDRLQSIRNILIFHGDADDVVPFSNALDLYEKVSEPKRLIRQHGGDHLMSDPKHQAEFIRESTSWFVQTPC
ncbi:MAG: hypothetical protein A2V65_12480 [Deltaproteobacteria bacterium RBG_13_49_15]|nr:MAG: hypothetical protein A2V65_12480 [Deltaproteobacteria bacterium RBG_13_49_15]